jgi:hypothetical protein
MCEHLQEMIEAALLILSEGASLREGLQILKPGIEALPDLGVGDLFLLLGPTAIQNMLSFYYPLTHAPHPLNAALPLMRQRDTLLETLAFLLVRLVYRCPFFSISSKLFWRAVRPS